MALTNNDIFKKLRVAHKLRDEDIVDICKLANFNISKTELGSFFRNEEHEKFVPCGDQVLRNFLDGLIVHLRGPMPDKRPQNTTQKPEQKSGKKPFKKFSENRPPKPNLNNKRN